MLLDSLMVISVIVSYYGLLFSYVEKVYENDGKLVKPSKGLLIIWSITFILILLKIANAIF